MALDTLAFARMLVDPAVPRREITRLVAGMTPAKIAETLALLTPVEILQAMQKMRVRRTPSIQAHVTNRVDHPLLIAADAASAVALGFRELETTVPVLRDSPSNALALLIGSQLPGRGADAVLGRGGDRARARNARTHDVCGDGVGLRNGAGVRRRGRHAVVEGVSRLLLRISRPEDALHVGFGRRGADGRVGGQVDAVPRGAVRRRHAGGGRSGRPERRHRRCQRHRLRARRDARGDRREPLRDAPRPRVVHRQRHADVGVRHPPHRPHAADPARRLGLPLFGLRLDPGLRQRVRPVELQRRGHRRLPRHPARLGLRGRPPRARRRGAPAAAPPGGRSLPRRLDELGLADVRDEDVEAAVVAHGSLDLPELSPDMVPTAGERIVGGGSPPSTPSARSLPAATSSRPSGCSRCCASGSTATSSRPRRSSTRNCTSCPPQRPERLLRAWHRLPNVARASGGGRWRSVRSGRRATSLQEQALGAGCLRLADMGRRRRGRGPTRSSSASRPPSPPRSGWRSSGMTVAELLRQVLAGIEEEGLTSRLVRVQRSIDLGAIGWTAAQLSGSGISVGRPGEGDGADPPCRPAAAREPRAVLDRAARHAELCTAASGATPPATRRGWRRSRCCFPSRASRSARSTTRGSSSSSRSSGGAYRSGRSGRAGGRHGA